MKRIAVITAGILMSCTPLLAWAQEASTSVSSAAPAALDQSQALVSLYTQLIQLLQAELTILAGGSLPGSGSGIGSGSSGGSDPLQSLFDLLDHPYVNPYDNANQLGDQQNQPTCTMNVEPQTIAASGSAALVWSSQNANSATISSLGAVGTSGTQHVNPMQTTTYTGTFIGDQGSAFCSATVTVSGSAAPPLPIPPQPSGVSISSITPTMGHAGTDIMVSGFGFAQTNTVHFLSPALGPLGSSDVTKTENSSDGTTLHYQVIAPSCTGGECMVALLPGIYQILVANQNGTSNSMPFTVQ